MNIFVDSENERRSPRARSFIGELSSPFSVPSALEALPTSAGD